MSLQIQHARGDLGLLMIGGKGGQGMKGAMGAVGVSSNGLELRFSKEKGGNLYCAKGGPGGMGGPGARGGRSGNAEIVIVDDNNFDLVTDRQGGAGGSGGDGGDGGRAGGIGNYCLDVDKEPRGDVGPRGPQGETGPIQDICITKGSGNRQCI